MGNTTSGDSGRYRYGYHVLRVKDHSPSSQAGLRPFFDYIVAVNDIRLDITPESPAEEAGLRAHSDYIIGTPLGVTRGEGDLYELIEEHIGEPLPLHVYNADTDQVREVVIVPNEDWGGEGLLGCDVGYGYLHRLPNGPIRHQDEKRAQNEITEIRVEEGPALSEEQTTTNFPPIQTQGGFVSLATTENAQHRGTGIGTQTFTPSDHIQTDKPTHIVQPNAEENSISTMEQEPTKSDSPNSDNILQSNANGTPELTLQKSEPTQAALGHCDMDVSSTDVHSSLQAHSHHSRPETSKVASHASSSTAITDKPADGSLSQKIKSATSEPSAETTASVDSTTTQDTPISPPIVSSDSVVQEQVDTTKQEQEQEPSLPNSETRRQPPLAIAARMNPGIHGRGARKGHDGFSERGGVSLRDVQAQAQQQSAEYRTQMERYESEYGPKDSQKQESQRDEDSQEDKDRGDRQEPQNAEPEVHEYVVEGMIRNMSLGSSIFPL
ncbi:Golgi reassembly-stacking protein 2 [Entomortierella chlamydospora]|uniref:Golgi reassembly-stacking protein 2 n=1 Tax=Entomortierella chlamydospora TaxID=101097 RepID=A0A9P6T1Y2_9FUNG|nr:Golgi reassembly-stacking protein 2 [Entomortierella chlamydospora]